MRISKKNKKLNNRHKKKTYKKKKVGAGMFSGLWRSSDPKPEPIKPPEEKLIDDEMKQLSNILNQSNEIYKSYMLVKNPSENGTLAKAKKWLAYKKFYGEIEEALKQFATDEKRNDKDILCELFDCEKPIEAEKKNINTGAVVHNVPPESPGGRPKIAAKIKTDSPANPVINVKAPTENVLNNKFPGLTKIIENGFTSLKQNQKNIKNKLTEISSKFPKKPKTLPGKGITTSVKTPKKEADTEMKEIL